MLRSTGSISRWPRQKPLCKTILYSTNSTSTTVWKSLVQMLQQPPLRHAHLKCSSLMKWNPGPKILSSKTGRSIGTLLAGAQSAAGLLHLMTHLSMSHHVQETRISWASRPKFKLCLTTVTVRVLARPLLNAQANPFLNPTSVMIGRQEPEEH